MFVDFLACQRAHRWPPNSCWEFRITELDPGLRCGRDTSIGGQWEITLVYLGVGNKGKGKGKGADSRECWAYGGDSPLG